MMRPYIKLINPLAESGHKGSRRGPGFRDRLGRRIVSSKREVRRVPKLALVVLVISLAPVVAGCGGDDEYWIVTALREALANAVSVMAKLWGRISSSILVRVPTRKVTPSPLSEEEQEPLED